MNSSDLSNTATATLPVAMRSVAWCLLIVLVGIGAWLRFEIASADPLWLDELHTGWVVADQLGDVANRASIGNQTPAYFLLTWLSVQVVGNNELGLRTISLVAGLALLVGLPLLVRQWTGSLLAAWVAAVWIGFDETLIRYSTEARPYALLMLLGGLQAMAFLRSLQLVLTPADGPCTKLRGHIPLVVSTLAVVYTHYTGVLMLVPESLVLLYCCCHSTSTHWRNIVTSSLLIAGIIGAGLLPLAWSGTEVATRRSNWQSVASVGNTIRSIAPWLLAGVAIPLAVKWTLDRTSKFSDRRTLAICAIVVGVYLSILLIHLSGLAPLALPRYFAVAMAVVPLAAAIIIGSGQTVRQRALLSVVVLGVLLGWWSATESWTTQAISSRSLPPMRTESWDRAVDRINSDSQASDWPLFLFASVIEDIDAYRDSNEAFLHYLQFPLRSLYPVGPPERRIVVGPTLDRQHFRQQDIVDSIEAGGAWLLIRHQSEIVNEIATQYVQQVQTKLSADARIHVQAVYPDPDSSGWIHLIRVNIRSQSQFNPIFR